MFQKTNNEKNKEEQNVSSQTPKILSEQSALKGFAMATMTTILIFHNLN